MKVFLVLFALALPGQAQDLDALIHTQAQLRAAPRLKRFLRPRYDASCVLEGVLSIMRLPARPDVKLALIFLESDTPLSRFSDAMETQWGMRPGVFTNAYAAARNEIYLINDAEYYQRMGRFVDDSLAHELTHYVQVKYKAVPIEQFDDSMEHEAVAVQTEFRERFMKPGVSPCASH